MNYYTYAYLREDGTPYYIGKGTKNRIDNRHVNVTVPPEDRRIYLKRGLSEIDAFRHEMYMIDVLGRKDLGTGILINRTPGGEGNSGPRPCMRGINNPRYGKPSIQRDKIWVTDGKSNRMVHDVPEGWTIGRTNVQTNKEQFRQQGLNNNPNAKKYRIKFRNGEVVECHQLSKWGHENGIKYSALKSVVHRTRYNKNQQFHKKSSPVSHIESIHVI
jgi:hypothetical protein